MTYVFAFKRNGNQTWNIGETTANMTEREFLQYILDSSNVFDKIDAIRILEIIER